MIEPKNAARNRADQIMMMELLIAHLMRIGVLISFVIVLIGILWVVASGQTGYHSINLDDLNSIIAYREGHPDFPNTLGDVITGMITLKPYAVISLGLLVLVAIPVMWVAVSIAAFARQRDWLYVGITAFVLAMLLLSFALGEAGG